MIGARVAATSAASAAAPPGSGENVSTLRTPTTPSLATSGKRELGDDPRGRLDEVGVARDVQHDLRRPLPHGTPDHALARGEPLGDHRVPSRPHEPEPAVLEHEHCRERAVEAVVQLTEGGLDRERGLCRPPRRLDRVGAGGMQLLARDPARSHQGM